MNVHVTCRHTSTKLQRMWIAPYRSWLLVCRFRARLAQTTPSANPGSPSCFDINTYPYNYCGFLSSHMYRINNVSCITLIDFLVCSRRLYIGTVYSYQANNPFRHLLFYMGGTMSISLHWGSTSQTIGVYLFCWVAHEFPFTNAHALHTGLREHFLRICVLDKFALWLTGFS